MSTDNKPLQDPASIFTQAFLENQQNLELQRIEALKKDRRDRNIWRVLIAGMVISGIALYAYAANSLFNPRTGLNPKEDYISLVQIRGVISPDSPASTLRVNASLTKAFEDTNSKGVVLLINSPGGTPVQASNIANRIKQLRMKFPDKPIVAIGEDLVTSGAYMVAAATDEVYINRSTITGSIGVIMQGFGFSRLIDTFGVERRVYTAGESKNKMDAWMPENPNDVKKIEEMLTKVHLHFIDVVTEYRGERLDSQYPELWSGDVWVGQEAVEIGLVDGISDLPTLMETKFGVKQFKDYTTPSSIFSRIGRSFGSQFKEQLVQNQSMMSVW